MIKSIGKRGRSLAVGNEEQPHEQLVLLESFVDLEQGRMSS